VALSTSHDVGDDNRLHNANGQLFYDKNAHKNIAGNLSKGREE